MKLSNSLLLILFLGLTACGDQREFTTIDPTFKSIYTEFEQDHLYFTGESITLDIAIGFKSINEPTIQAKCHKHAKNPFGPSQFEIYVDPDQWSIRSPINQKALIYHELGHCFLQRGHSNNTKSLMHHESMGKLNHLPKHNHTVIEELFNFEP